MAKSKQQASKPPKKRSTKYSKLATVCSKELTAKKAALVRAEKALAKAQKTHTELLSEVARLDMLDRSLKALINGTEPPQNVRYVYTYPQWVWNGYPYGWYWNGNTWTTGNFNYSTLQTPVTSNIQGGQFYQSTAGSNTINGINAINTISTTLPSITTSTAGSLTGSAFTVNCSNAGLDSGISATTASTPTTWTMTSTAVPSMDSSSDLTVDLSTGATEEESKPEPEVESLTNATPGLKSVSIS